MVSILKNTILLSILARNTPFMFFKILAQVIILLINLAFVIEIIFSIAKEQSKRFVKELHTCNGALRKKYPILKNVLPYSSTNPAKVREYW
jgi:hypothetical protein